ncbi:MAG: transglutaminase-like domain-containing protein [Verrucomicrobiales bacterium]
MNLPRQVPGVYGLAYLLWAKSSGEWVLGILLALTLELPRLLNRRIEVDARAYRMVWLMSLLLEWILAINGWLEGGRIESMRSVLKWTPVALAPLAVASAWAIQPGIPVSSLLLLLRNRFSRPSMGGVVPVVPRIDPFFPYLWVLLVATSYQSPGSLFFPAAVVLVAAAVLAQPEHRRRFHSSLAWITIAVGLSMVFHTGIIRVYRFVENAIYGRMQLQGPQEVNRTLARIGSVGEIKLSKQVLWYVTHESGPAPEYLYEATYDGFDPVQNAWLNSQRDNRKFERVPSSSDIRPPDQWSLGGTGQIVTRARVRGEISEEFAVLPLPENAAIIQSLPAYRLDRNGLGVVRADLARPVINMSVTGTTGTPLRPDPEPSVDLELGRALPVVAETAEKLGLANLPPEEAVRRIRGFFATNFSYTRKAGMLSARSFLETERLGHCEYFASGTALLLRAAGIPSRYHTGFALVELDPRTRQWKVRGTHAHAWATAWLDGRWQVIDTTPSNWLEQDSEGIDFWQMMQDWWEEKRLAFQDWRTSGDTGGLLAWLAPTLAALVVLYTIIRILLRRKKKRTVRVEPVHELPVYATWEANSRWSVLLPALERSRGMRPENLPALTWVRGFEDWSPALRGHAATLVRDHYRRRFGTAGSAALPEDPALLHAEESLRQHLGIS